MVGDIRRFGEILNHIESGLVLAGHHAYLAGDGGDSGGFTHGPLVCSCHQVGRDTIVEARGGRRNHWHRYARRPAPARCAAAAGPRSPGCAARTPPYRTARPGFTSRWDAGDNTGKLVKGHQTVNGLRNMCCGCVLGALLVAGLGGCNQRSLFKDTDVAAQRRLRSFDTYDSESAKAAADRRKQQSEWGFGPPMLFGSGAQ